MNSHSFLHKDEELILLPERCIYWPAQKALLIADTHLGKITHFRKSGIAVPDRAAYRNLQRLESLLKDQRPEKVYFLGDLFHSELNSEWLAFKALLRSYPEIRFILIQGNHDILHEVSYANLKFEVHTEPLNIGPFTLSHEPLQDSPGYNLCGHIHPGVRMSGAARQSMRLPCFYFGEKGGILPAFGEFTGLHILQPKKQDQVFIIAGSKVMKAA
ncbi:MAG: ligase-associated DNA damage response endonuclease PdeM [Owenweeksia sp.]